MSVYGIIYTTTHLSLRPICLFVRPQRFAAALLVHDMMLIHSGALVLALSFSSFTGVDAFFRINCAIIQTGRIDPIVNPVGIAAHAHTIVGASNIGVNSTYNSLVASECTTCQITSDKSAYWTPNLYYQHPNNTFEYVPHTGSVVYYLSRGSNTNITRFPPGFQMLSGDKALRAPNQAGLTWGNATYPPRQISEAVSFACLGQEAMPETNYLPPNIGTLCTYGMRAQIHFQTCWNGRDLYKQDNSHVAHTSSIDNGICPPNYPVQLPHIFIETNYAVNQVSDFSNGGRFVFSQGDPTGYGFHADFVNGWDPDVLQNAIENCLTDGFAEFGTIEECPILLQHNSPFAGENCPPRPLPILEPVFGLVDRLPGCIRVTEGPGAATAADMNCPAGVKQPSIVTTRDSTPLQTSMPKIGQPFGNPHNIHLGCGNDTYGSFMRTLAAVYYQDDSMTIELCQGYCNSRGYRISGVEFGTQCYCDLAVNPTTIFNDTEGGLDGCLLSCRGNRSEICGGGGYINVYNNTDPYFVSTTDVHGSVIQLTTPIAAFSANYIGCASEGTNARALNGSSFNSDDMTLGLCAQKCKEDNYRYYGLEYRSQCYCGNGLASGGRIIDTLPSTNTTLSACNMRCAGDFSQVCGQGGYLSVYENSAYTPVAVTEKSGRYLSKGCLVEPVDNSRALVGNSTTMQDMTPQKCIKFCLGSRFHYAGIEYGVQCFCSNSISPLATITTCDTETLFHCPGNKLTYCGAGNLLNYYYSSTL